MEPGRRYDCWESTPAIAQWMKERQFSAADAYGYFVQRAGDIVRARGRSVVNWVEVFERLGTSLDKDTIVHVWKSKATLAKVRSMIGDMACHVLTRLPFAARLMPPHDSAGVAIFAGSGERVPCASVGQLTVVPHGRPCHAQLDRDVHQRTSGRCSGIPAGARS